MRQLWGGGYRRKSCLQAVCETSIDCACATFWFSTFFAPRPPPSLPPSLLPAGRRYTWTFGRRLPHRPVWRKRSWWRIWRAARSCCAWSTAGGRWSKVCPPSKWDFDWLRNNVDVLIFFVMTFEIYVRVFISYNIHRYFDISTFFVIFFFSFCDQLSLDTKMGASRWGEANWPRGVTTIRRIHLQVFWVFRPFCSLFFFAICTTSMGMLMFATNVLRDKKLC